MSELALGGLLAGKMGNDALLDALGGLQQLIKLQTEQLLKPFIFLKSNNNNLSSNVADGVIILSGPVIRENQKGIVEDFNINFTTAAGTVRLVIVDAISRPSLPVLCIP